MDPVPLHHRQTVFCRPEYWSFDPALGDGENQSNCLARGIIGALPTHPRSEGARSALTYGFILTPHLPETL
jgi:hypothetical protein